MSTISIFRMTLSVFISIAFLSAGCKDSGQIANNTVDSKMQPATEPNRIDHGQAGSNSSADLKGASTGPDDSGGGASKNRASAAESLPSPEIAGSAAPDLPSATNESVTDSDSKSSRNPNIEPPSTEPVATKELKLPPAAESTGKTGTDPGDTIPEIEGTDIDSEEFALSDYSGKVVMLDFWGDW